MVPTLQRRHVLAGATTIYDCRRAIAATSRGVIHTRSEEERQRDTLGPLLTRRNKASMSIYKISKFSLLLDILDITSELQKRWGYAAPAPHIHDLRRQLERPLEEDEKVPVSQEDFDELLNIYDGDLDMNTLDPETLSTLFRVSPNKHAPRIALRFAHAIHKAPPSTGTEESFHGTYDANISDIIRLIILGVKHGRNTNKGTSTALKWPDNTLSTNNNCIFRGEEKGSETHGSPRIELYEKIVRWLWHPLGYILGLS